MANGTNKMPDKDKIVGQASGTIDALSAHAKDALDRAANGAEQAREGVAEAWRVAGKARDQVSDLAGEVVTRGQQTARAVGQRVEAQPYLALGIVGLFGVMLGYMLRGR